MWNIFLNVFKPDIHCVYILHSSYSLSDMNENNGRIIVFFSLYIHTWPEVKNIFYTRLSWTRNLPSWHFFNIHLHDKYTEQKWKRYTTIVYVLRFVLYKTYFQKLNNVSQTPSKRFVERPPICLFWCLSIFFCVLSFIHWILQLPMRKKDCYSYQNWSLLCCIKTQEHCLGPWNKLGNQFQIYQICILSPFDNNK